MKTLHLYIINITIGYFFGIYVTLILTNVNAKVINHIIYIQ